MYAKTKDGQIAQYPYGYSELQADNPYTNFNGADLFQAFQGTEANLAGYILEVVNQQEQPQYDSKMQVVSLSDTPVFEAGQWVLKWSVRDKTSEELYQQYAAQADSVRASRNQKLTESDWVVIKALEAGGPQDFAWASYRQALRDITAQPGFPWTITWPDAP